MAGPADARPAATSWTRVMLLVLGGVAIATQVGKMPAALPALREELGLSLVAAGWAVSAFSIIAAAAGLLFGGAADRLGHLRIAVAGLAASAAANVAGAAASSGWSLLAGRFAEGLGFILCVVALPPLIVAQCAPRDVGKALGIWGAFLPAGMGGMLLASPPILEAAGWRGLWLVTAGLLGAWALVLLMVFRGHQVGHGSGGAVSAGQVLSVVGGRGPLLLALCFGAYSAQFLAVTSFLPTLLIDQGGIALATAATLGAIVVLGNIIGNTASGWLLAAGLSRPLLIAIGFVLMGATSIAVFTSALPLFARVAAAFVFTSGGGLIPGALMSSAPVYAPAPALVATVIGLLLQGAGIGQVFGAPALARVVTAFGAWDYAPVFTCAAALAGLAAAAGLAAVRPRAAK